MGDSKNYITDFDLKIEQRAKGLGVFNCHPTCGCQNVHVVLYDKKGDGFAVVSLSLAQVDQLMEALTESSLEALHNKCLEQPQGSA